MYFLWKRQEFCGEIISIYSDKINDASFNLSIEAGRKVSHLLQLTRRQELAVRPGLVVEGEEERVRRQLVEQRQPLGSGHRASDRRLLLLQAFRGESCTISEHVRSCQSLRAQKGSLTPLVR